MIDVLTQHLPTLSHLGHLEDLQNYPEWLQSPDDLTPQEHPIYATGGVHGTTQSQQETMRSESWELSPGNYTLHTYHMGQWFEAPAEIEHNLLKVRSTRIFSDPDAATLVELSQDEMRWTVMIKAKATDKRSQDADTQMFSIYKTQLEVTHNQLLLEEEPVIPVRLDGGGQHSLFGFQQSPSVLDVTGRRVAIAPEEATARLADLLLAHRPPYGRTLVYADGDLDLFDHFALQEVGRLLGIKNLYGSSIWGAEALAAGQKLQNSPVHSTLEEILELENPLFLFNGWNGLLHHPTAFEKLAQHNTAHIWIIDSLVQESAKYLLAQHPRCELLLIRPGSEGLLALCIARCLFEKHNVQPPSTQNEGFVDYQTLANSSIFSLDKMIAELVLEPRHTETLKEQVLRLAQQLIDTDCQAAHIPGNGLFQSGGTQSYCLWHNLLHLVNKRYEWQSFETRNEGLQIEHFGPRRFFGNLPMNKEGCTEAARRVGLPEEAYLPLLKENIRPIQEFLTPSQGSQRELILCIGHGLEARWIRDHQQWYEKIKASDAVLVVLDSMPGPFMRENAALCLPLSPEMSQYQLRQEGCSYWYHDLPKKVAPLGTQSAATWMYNTIDKVGKALSQSPHFQKGHPDLAKLAPYLNTRFSETVLPRKDTEVCRDFLWQRIQHYMQHKGNYGLSWNDILKRSRLPLTNPLKNKKAEDFCYFVPQQSDFLQPRDIVLNIGSSIPNATFKQVQHAIQASTIGHAYDYGSMPAHRKLYLSESLATQMSLKSGDAVQLSQPDVKPVNCAIQTSPDLLGKSIYFSHYLSKEELHAGQIMPWMRFRVGGCPYSDVPLLKKIQLTLTPFKETEHA